MFLVPVSFERAALFHGARFPPPLEPAAGSVTAIAPNRDARRSGARKRPRWAAVPSRSMIGATSVDCTKSESARPGTIHSAAYLPASTAFLRGSVER